ncbi:hypothetical protein CCR94_18935 [Rhodoblastus sphagnicola]|uniref:Oxidoreductase n=1 Tax=Rhodoblastus sphagnicola TaxID=333368 RepID=A0A2S6MZZ9_9HYPH|nr:DUF934 domain-containing protein [Rhodoblastus sphagnicola]MBB4197925.1 uncharacterized protein (DUF934 family) [Rhodoblastus sphagnicola]PPQ27932.1 hypothetical protein CCR94_18935 [Rhodoblastus sphagnicola]
MLLLDRNGAKADPFARVETLDDVAGKAVIVAFDAAEKLLAAAPAQAGVFAPNTLDAEQLSPFLDRLALIAIAFPSATDGRGFSLARQLRRLGFKGILRASGPLFSDQFPQALACGFDEVEIPDANAARQPVQQWLDALKRVTVTYQRDYAQGERILDRRARS